MSDLYELYADPLYRFVHVRTQNHAASEDICQEVWLKVVRLIGGYEKKGVAGFPGWLFTIARTVAADHFRAGARRPETPTADMLSFNTPALDVGPEEAAVRGHVAEVLAQAIGRLAKSQAQCLILRFFDGLSLAETAAVMDSTVGAVKQTQLRGLRALAAVLPPEIRILGASVNVTNLHLSATSPVASQR